jgi:RecA-family ATPase
MAQDIGAFPNLQMLARALGGEVSNGQVLAPGPGHSPKDRSLSVKLDTKAPDGFVVHSFSIDDPIACRDFVREKLNLPAFKLNGRRRVSDDTVERALMAAVGVQSQTQKPKGKLSAQYDYQNADGTLLYQVLRYDDPKDFRQRRPNGNGGWIWKLDDRRVVYRWLELLKYPDAAVFITEGEKDADRVAELNLCATTVAAGKWTEDCIKALADRDVVILQDNDDAGRKKALNAAQALRDTAKTIRIVALPDLPDGGDVSDWLDADPRRAKQLAEVCFAIPEWSPDQASSPGHPEEHAKAATPTSASPEHKTTTNNQAALSVVAIPNWEDLVMPKRQWIVDHRVPANNVTLLSGDGSVGKSILSLQLAAAVVLGRDWLGTLPEPGPVLAIYCEDDEDELHRRLDPIRQHYGARYTDFAQLHLSTLAGKDALMATADRFGLIKATKLFEQVRQAACNYKPKLIVLDNVADIYGGNENDRAEVRGFIGLLRGLAIETNAAVLLTSHPSLTGLSNRTGLSGSTAWNASVRSRLYLERAKTEKDEEPDPDLRVLEVMKSNYGPVGERINLRWKDGLFLPVGGMNNLERAAAEQAAEQLFLTLLDEFNRQGRHTSAKPNAPTYAPTLFAKEKQARQRGIRKADLETAMRNLFATGKVCLEQYGPPSRATSKLVRK